MMWMMMRIMIPIYPFTWEDVLNSEILVVATLFECKLGSLECMRMQATVGSYFCYKLNSESCTVNCNRQVMPYN